MTILDSGLLFWAILYAYVCVCYESMFSATSQCPMSTYESLGVIHSDFLIAPCRVINAGLQLRGREPRFV